MTKKPTMPKKGSPKSKKAVSDQHSSSISDAQSSPASRKARSSLSRSKSSKLQDSSIRKPVPKRKYRGGHQMMIVGNKAFKISNKIFREIKKLQISTNNLIPKLPFSKLVYEILSQYASLAPRIQRRALHALQEAAENYLVGFFADSYSCSLHARRSTLLPRDMGLLQYLRHE